MTRAARSRGLAALLVSLAACGLLTACGGATPRAASPEPPIAAAVAGKKAQPKLELVKTPLTLPASAEALTDDDDNATTPERQMLGMLGGPASPRAPIEPQQFRIAELPRAEIPEPLAPSQAPIVSADGEQATDLFVDWESAHRSNSVIGRPETYTSVRVSLRGQNLARIRIGNNEGTVGQGAAGGVYVVCRVPEDALRRFVTARWESLSASPRGEAALSVVDAWFDMHTCKATIVKRTRVALKPLAGGIFFGYREPCEACSTGDKATFIGPHPQHISTAGVGGEATVTMGALSRLSLPVRRGGGGSVLVRYSPGVLRDWFRTLGRDDAPNADVIAGIDVVQGVADSEPVALAYVSSAPPESVGFEQSFRAPTHVRIPHPRPPQKSPALLKQPAKNAPRTPDLFLDRR